MAVGEESPGAEGKRPTVVIQGLLLSPIRVRLIHGNLLALLVLIGHFSVACLNAVLLHGEGPVDIVQFKVESTGVTHRLSVGVASPQCCCACVTVGTQCTGPLADNQSLLGSDQGSVLAVHLVVQSTGVAQVVACTIPTPQRGGCGSTVNTLSGLWSGYPHLIAEFGGERGVDPRWVGVKGSRVVILWACHVRAVGAQHLWVGVG